MTDSLDSLWDEAVRSQSKRTVRASPAKDSKAPKPLTSDTFSNLDNYTCVGGVALIHAETTTLLGNFIEFKHKRQPHCTWLRRTEEPISVLRTQMVSGPQWTQISQDIPSAQSATSSRDVLMVPLCLHELGVQAEAAELKVLFQWGGIIRAELKEHTSFHSPDNRSVLTLGAGTNVYEVMDLNAKLAMREELK